MQRKSASLSLVALAALFAGCEWTSTSGSDSWSGSYDAMNFGGSYRITTLALTSSSESSSTSHGADWATVGNESGGTFAAGAAAASGHTREQNIVPGSVKISCGGYVWTDDGSRGLVFSGGSSSSASSQTKVYNGTDKVGNLTLDQSYSHQISVMKQPGANIEIIAGSVSVTIGNKVAFQDNGSGVLAASGVLGSGSVNYKNGVVAFSLESTAMSGQSWSVSYQYANPTGGDVVTGLTGSGSIQYESGAWSLSVSPKMPSSQSISVTYSYYTETSASYTGIDTTKFDPTRVSAITVSQTGQNLTMSFNNGVVMAGRFTSVRQTAAVSKDTGAGADTYNAQFQVSSGSEAKMVGTLYYDYPTHNRVLDGTWTWGRKTFDVHAVGPAWTESGTTTAAELN